MEIKPISFDFLYFNDINLLNQNLLQICSNVSAIQKL